MKPSYRLPIAALLLSCSLTSGLAQAPPSPNGDGGQSAAPVERHTPNSAANPHRHHGPDMDPTFGMLPPGMWWKTPETVQAIGLSPDQVNRIEAIFDKARVHLIDLKANLDKQTFQLEPLLNANPVDQVKASAQIDKVADARADLEKANAKMLLGIRGVLTPEQWTKLQSHPDHGGYGPMPGGPGGGI